MSPDNNDPKDLVQRNEDGSLTKETRKRAMKAFRRRLKLTRLDDESRVGHSPMSTGRASSIVGVRPPDHYPPEVWEELADNGQLRRVGDRVYEIPEV